MSSVIKTDDIHVQQFKTGCLAQYTYVIESQGQIAIIDPLRDVASYLALAAESNAKVVWVLETHYHADFVSGHVELAKLSGATIVFGPDSNPAFDCKVAKHNEVLPLGNHSLRVLHTPGHTFESSSYVLESPEGKALAVFTGDTLFLGDVGRPDLAQKGEFTDKDLAKLMFHSLKLLKNLPDDCLILPAHGAGSACGKNIQPGDHCNIGNQKKTNKAFGEEDEEKFIEMATANIAPPPSYFGLSIALNKSPEIDSVHQVVEKGFQSLNPDQVKELAQDESVFILDCRPAGEFIQGHVPHSVWVPLDMTFAIWAAFVVDPRKGEKVVLVTPPGKEKEAVTRLTRTGIDCVVGYLDGGFDSWKQAGFDIGETKVVDFDSHDDFHAKIEGARVVDVRNLGEWQDGVLDHATLLTLSKVKEGTATSSDKKQKIIMQCRTGMRSLMAASLAIRLGWTDVANLAGGIEKIKTKNVAISPMNKQPVATL